MKKKARKKEKKNPLKRKIREITNEGNENLQTPKIRSRQSRKRRKIETSKKKKKKNDDKFQKGYDKYISNQKEYFESVDKTPLSVRKINTPKVNTWKQVSSWKRSLETPPPEIFKILERKKEIKERERKIKEREKKIKEEENNLRKGKDKEYQEYMKYLKSVKGYVSEPLTFKEYLSSLELTSFFPKVSKSQKSKQNDEIIRLQEYDSDDTRKKYKEYLNSVNHVLSEPLTYEEYQKIDVEKKNSFFSFDEEINFDIFQAPKKKASSRKNDLRSQYQRYIDSVADITETPMTFSDFVSSKTITLL